MADNDPASIAAELEKYVTAAQAAAGDENALVEATQALAVAIGDAGLSPGDGVTLSDGTVYSSEFAYFRVTFLGLPVSGSAGDGSLFCRNGKALEETDMVVADAEAQKLRGAEYSGDIPAAETARAEASIAERMAFVAELPELARTLSALALSRKSPEIGKAAKVAQKAAAAVAAEGPGVAL